MNIIAKILILTGVIKLLLIKDIHVTETDSTMFSSEILEGICKFLVISESIIQIFCSLYIITNYTE